MNSLAIAQITSAVRSAVARMRADDPDTDAEALAALVEQEAPEFGDMLAALCRAADEAGASVSAIKERIAALEDRKLRHEARREEYRALIFAALDAAGQTKWKSPEFTVSITPGRPGVVITDPAAIPDDFVRVRREPDKTAIGSAIASGATVPGAELKNSMPSLRISTR